MLHEKILLENGEGGKYLTLEALLRGRKRGVTTAPGA
jgi:hypothetical protein